MKPTFSFLMPTRRRPELAIASINALRALATHPNTIEVLVRCDNDDKRAAKKIAKACPFVTMRVGKRHGSGRLHLYWNELAELAQGDWLVPWNDDAEMQTYGYDTVVCSVGRPVSVVAEMGPHPFPFVSRGAYEAVGSVMGLGCAVDSIWENSARRADCLIPTPITILHRYLEPELAASRAANNIYARKHDGVAYDDEWAVEWALKLRTAGAQ